MALLTTFGMQKGYSITLAGSVPEKVEIQKRQFPKDEVRITIQNFNFGRYIVRYTVGFFKATRQRSLNIHVMYNMHGYAM